MFILCAADDDSCSSVDTSATQTASNKHAPNLPVKPADDMTSHDNVEPLPRGGHPIICGLH